MHDLRKQALLESKKTTSRKARSRQPTPASSKRTTPVSSRAASKVRGGSSRGDSDEENDAELSDETSFSVGSIDELLNGDASEPMSEGALADRIEEIFSRKGSTIPGREKCYKTYIHYLVTRYSGDGIDGKEEELVAAFLKSIREEDSEKETMLAAKAIAITLTTSPSEDTFEIASNILKRAITDSDSVTVMTATIHALAICTFYGGASDEATLEIMDFLLEIVTSDGNSISAPDESDPVVAALEEWGFLCTLVDDMSSQSEESIEAFIEQLNSAYASVQIAAGENIALLYEKSFKPLDAGEDSEDYRDEDIVSDPLETPGIRPLIRLYPAYRRTDQLLHALTTRTRTSVSVHSVSKADRKALKTSLSDVAQSIEYPHFGPRYSTAIDDNTEMYYGSRMKVKIHDQGVMTIDKWWKLFRLEALKRVLQGGFVTHYEDNPTIFETLPILVSAPDAYKKRMQRPRKVSRAMSG
ncbi:uncharacterized protein KY384_006088 [Bacidia gigantensis]|uniref:uncharacterized protein n=1 Tax=Bacidia gigantensis TaxID=2732470 RepID=UPI001D0548AD|nr:uncharacterized protein KY384_006088 [Bacidia gigantensis]KAG8529451.1 hypothetical protein KY384_006088 [Bacidia gigantensis]